MEKIKIYYGGTGIKTLRTIATIALILGFIGAAVFIYSSFIDTSEYMSIKGDFAINWTTIITGLIILVGGIIASGACQALATIAETALIKRKIMIHKLSEEGLEIEEDKIP